MIKKNKIYKFPSKGRIENYILTVKSLKENKIRWVDFTTQIFLILLYPKILIMEILKSQITNKFEKKFLP